MNLLIIDNYDSFTYNLVYLLKPYNNVNLTICRNDEFSDSIIISKNIDRIIISPGPGTPDTSGMTLDIIRKYYSVMPIMGVCLGMQAIAVFFGSTLIRCKNPFHGKTSLINHNNQGIFSGLPQPFPAMRYHSLEVDNKSLNSQLEITARTDDNIIMALKHKSLPLAGMQFHPESILTPDGRKLLGNWLKS